jgi:hypothetical protein
LLHNPGNGLAFALVDLAAQGHDGKPALSHRRSPLSNPGSWQRQFFYFWKA